MVEFTEEVEGDDRVDVNNDACHEHSHCQLLPVEEDRAEHGLEELDVHDQVEEMDGEIERIPMEPQETECTVHQLVQHHLMCGMSGSAVHVN